MHFLLINDNPAVSRLILLSVEKLGFRIDEIPSFQEIPRENYDMVFVNNVQYDEEMVHIKKMDRLSKHFIYIGARGESKPSNMDFVIEKPFLPTDFIDLVTKIDTDSNEHITEPEEFIDDFELPKLKDDVDVFADEKDSLNNEDTDIPLNLSDLQENEIGLDEEILEESEKENNTQAEEDDENLDSVLDRDEINEVKLLLEESSESAPTQAEEIKEEELSFDEPSEEADEHETISTLDDLSENDFLSAFRKEIIEDSTSDKKYFIEEELQSVVSKSVKDALQGSSIKDALKGMKVNISITFEDEE
jgi:uncharacterized membrane protein